MTRVRAVLAVVAALGVLAGATLAPGRPAGAVEPLPARVILISMPGLGWDDLAPGATPALTSLADRGAIGALSVKTIGRRTTAAEAYATIATGARTTAPSGAGSSGWSVGERLPSGEVAGEPGGRGVADPDGPAVVVPDLGAVEAANDGLHQGARLGALARSLGDQGWSTAVIANHDGPQGIDRTAALAVADAQGRVDLGSVAGDLVAAGPSGGLRTDRDELVRAIRALPLDDVVAVVEVGDVAWADAAGAAPAARRAALRSADRTLAAALGELRPDDLVVVLAPTAPRAQEQPTPVVVAGPGVEPGLLRSATTRRTGYVTLPDVPATILDRTGGEVPDAMSGTPAVVADAGGTGAERIADLRSTLAESRFVDRSAGIFLVTLPIVFAAWALAALVAAVAPLGRHGPAARVVVRWAGLTLAVVPMITFVVSALTVRGWGQPLWSAVVWGTAAVVGGLVLWRWPAHGGPVAIASLVWSVTVVDLLTGGRLQFDSPLGNSPTVAGRFAGIGNLSFGLLAASSLVLAVALWDGLHRRRAGARPLLAAGGVLLVSIVVVGAPDLGADVGGVLTLGPVAAVTLWSLAGRAISWGRLALAAVATLGVLGLAAAADLARPAEARTHLGRLVARLADGDGGTEVLWRKADAALGSFVRSSLVWIVLCSALLAVLLWRLARPAVGELVGRAHGRTLLLAGGLAAVLGGALNDSGVMVPAMMATVLVPAAVHLLLAPDGPVARPAAAPSSPAAAPPAGPRSPA